MEPGKNSVEVFNLVKSIIHHINTINFEKMAQKMISISTPFKTVYLFENIVDIIYARALNRHNFAVIYARLCAYMINDAKFNKLNHSKTTFQKVLAQKSFDVFISHHCPQNDLDKLKEKFKNNNMTPSNFKNTLNIFHFQYYNKALTNCKFIAELFKEGAFTKNIILACIEELMKERVDLKIHCLCIILKLVGPKLSKTHNLDDIVKHILSFKDENSTILEMSLTLNSLILEINNFHLNGWINEEPVKLIERNENYFLFERLPEQLKQSYELKSYSVMAQCVIDECDAILNCFDKKKSIDEVLQLLTKINSWIRHDQISFVVSMTLIALNENQNTRFNAGILLDEFVLKGLLSSDSVQLGINKVLGDSEIKIEFPRLSYLISDIISELASLSIN